MVSGGSFFPFVLRTAKALARVRVRGLLMNKQILLSATISLAISATATSPAIAQFTPAFEYTSSSTLSDGRPFTLGYTFDLSQATTINGLGFWNSGTLTDNMVGIWDLSGNLITSATVSAGDAVVGNYTWESISPLLLGAGSYVIGGEFMGGAFPSDLSGVTTNPDFTWLSDRQLSGGFAFPTEDTNGGYGQNGIALVNFSIRAATTDEIQDGRLTSLEASDSAQDTAIGQNSADITALQASDGTQDGQIAALQSSDSAQDGEIAALQISQDVQDGEIATLQASDTAQDGRLTAVETTNTAQDGRLTAVETTNTTQDGQITALQTSDTAQNGRLTVIETINATQGTQIAALESESQYVAINSTGGIPASATGTDAIAIGNGANASAADSVAIGHGAVAQNGAAVSIGKGNVASGTGAVAIGDPNVATGQGAVALGNDNIATGEGAVALGDNNSAVGLGAVALGNNSISASAGAIAIGNAALANGTNGVAVGNGASNASFANSVALGNGTVNTAANQISVGGRTIGGVANGVAASDAVNVGQLNAATAGIATSIAAINGSILGLQGDVTTLYHQNRNQDRMIGKANEGVAMALAMESPNVPAGSTFALSGGIGGFQGKNSLATAISAAIGEKATVSAGLGYGLNSGEVGYRAGFQVAF